MMISDNISGAGGNFLKTEQLKCTYLENSLNWLACLKCTNNYLNNFIEIFIFFDTCSKCKSMETKNCNQNSKKKIVME